METIMKIPFLLAMVSAIITGIISLAGNAGTNKTCIRMIIALVGFYVIGLLVSTTLSGIVEEQNKQKQEEEEKLKNEQQMLEEEAAKSKQEEHLGNNLDLFADSGLDDGFSPLDLSQAIRTKVNE